MGARGWKWLLVKMAADTAGPRVRTVLGVLCIWLVLIAQKFSLGFVSNELDYLPFAKQVVERDWLSGDWYLNLDIGYHRLFDVVFGWIIKWLGFQQSAYAGRLLVYLLIAVALFVLFGAIRLPFRLGLLAAMFFVGHQSMVAGEWIVGGVEAKPISYALVILSLGFVTQKRFLAAFAFAGAAVSFHVLVGCYALFCTAVAFVTNAEWRRDWRQCLRQAWPFFVSGALGMQAIIAQLGAPSSPAESAKAWAVYVQYRVPHHVLPSAWPGNAWMLELVGVWVFFVLVRALAASDVIRFLAAYALASLSLFVLGLVIFAAGPWALLRYYWFRFPDVMVPVLCAVVVGLLLGDATRGSRIVRGMPALTSASARGSIARFVLMLAIVTAAGSVVQFPYRLQSEASRLRQAEGTSRAQALEWISMNTPKQAIFLVDPTIEEFHVGAERAMFVSYKDAPVSAADVLEWYTRITLCNGGPPSATGKQAVAELHRNFYKLDATQIEEIAHAYGITYYLGSSGRSLPFERVYANAEFVLYRIVDVASEGPRRVDDGPEALIAPMCGVGACPQGGSGAHTMVTSLVRGIARSRVPV